MRGKLIFRYGAMGSAKTAHLLMTAFNFEEKGKNVYLAKPSIDTRSGNKISSRVPGLEKECILIEESDKIYDKLFKVDVPIDNLLNNIRVLPTFGYSPSCNSTVILIDEAQFLTKAQVDELTELSDEMGYFIICYGLRTDANTHLFEGSKRLMEISDTIEEIKSMCSCGHKAIINARLNEDGSIMSDIKNQVEIGGNDKYISLCRSCYTSSKGYKP